jgi:6-phosphogluconolactonase
MRLAWLVVVAACGGSSGSPATDGGSDATGDGMTVDARPTALFAYVSGYSSTITRYSLANGVLTEAGTTTSFANNPSFMAITPSSTNLYAASEATNRAGAYAIDQATGALTFINDVGVGGNGPAHIAVDATGQYVLIANYGNGTVSVAPVQANGGLGAVTQTLSPGANAHQIVLDPMNKYAFVPCLGVDRVNQYLFDATTGELTANAVPSMATAAGAGPRHLAFAPTASFAYLLNEKSSTVQALAFDAATGRLTSIQSTTTRAVGATGANTTAEVWVHPNGKSLYTSNRGDNNLAVFAIGGDGKLTLAGHRATGGATPRMFVFDPSGAFVYVANQGSNNVLPFSVDPTTGMLGTPGAAVSAASPSYVGIAALPR